MRDSADLSRRGVRGTADVLLQLLSIISEQNSNEPSTSRPDSLAGTSIAGLVLSLRLRPLVIVQHRLE